jgi:membrane peptidoglycan carboxypeptidase
MVAAVSSIANGGQYVEPRVVRAIYRGNRRYRVQPKIVRRTISADTAATLTTIMEGVVERGTARAAQIDGYTIAGKTGTSAKLINGHYSTTDWNASFVGFLPSRDPAVAIIVVTDSPHANGHTGGVVSAPVFKRIAEATLRYLAIGPTLNPDAPVLVAEHDAAASLPTSPDAPPAPIVSLVANGPPGTIPDLSGLSARDVIRELGRLGLTAKISGDGFVVSQEPSPGTPVDPGTACRVVLSRSPVRQQQSAAQP